MIRFRTRRRIALALTALVTVALLLWLWARDLALRDTAFVSGWLLLGAVLFLAAFNLRKKLPHPPLWSASTWLQLHLYIGLLTLALFVFHGGWAIPRGVLNGGLALLFVIVALSGLAGLGLSRSLPARLSVLGQEVIFERIPLFRRQLRERAEDLMVRAAEVSRTTTLPDFYRDELLEWFSGPANLGSHLMMSQAPLHRILEHLNALDRYLNPDEREVSRELAGLIREKDRLDRHRALQGALKGWLFVHVPATYALLLFAVLHLVVVYAFAGRLS